MLDIKSRCSVFTLAIAVVSVAQCWGGVYNVSINPRADEAYGRARYRLWIPDGVETIRGLIVRQHGCGPESRKFGPEYADDIQWRALAAKWDCGLIGTELFAPNDDCTTWIIPDDGSADALSLALERFSDMSRHPEIQHVPWCLWGYSGGALWATNMTYRTPDRIVATFSRSGGLSHGDVTYLRSQPAAPDSEPRVLDVPIMFCYGEEENQESSEFYQLIRGIHRVYEFGRANRAVWCLAVQPNCGHENGDSRHLAIRYFDACLALRLPSSDEVETQVRLAGRTGSTIFKLNTLNREDGWYTDPFSLAAHRVADFKIPSDKLGWLPSGVTARAWEEFSKTGRVVDESPPPAPTDARKSEQSGAISVTWTAVADIESGISEFRVYRDGEVVGVVKGRVVAPWNPAGHFHYWNDSDQPPGAAVRPAMRFVDRSTEGSTDCAYEVTTVNQAGLESPKCEAVIGTTRRPL